MRNKRLLIVFIIFLSVTLLIAIGSAVFSIKRVDAYCKNIKDDELIAKVLAQTEKDKLLGKSIFSLNEAELIKNIEAEVGGIKIVNIERLFPDRVSINFVKLYDYFEVLYDGKYYISGIDGKILRVQEESRGESVIKIRLNLNEEPAVGGEFTSAKHFDALKNIINMLERLDYRDADAAALISAIDLAYSESSIYVSTRSGVLIKLIHYDNVGEKLRKALSLYVAKPEYRTSGMIIAVNTDEVYHSPTKDNIYEESN